MESVGCRRLVALVGGLPPDSATHRGGKQWTFEREALASLVERQDVWGAHHALGQGWKAQALPTAISFQHPERVKAEQERKKADPAAIRRWFSRLRR